MPPRERRWPRLENALPDDQAVDRMGIRGESYMFAPHVHPGSIEAPDTSYFQVQQGITEQSTLTIWDGTEHHELLPPIGEE